MNGTGVPAALVWFGDEEGSCAGCSRAWLSWRGRALEAELGIGWLDGVHPDDRAASAMTLARHSALHSPVQLEFRLRRHDGLWRPMLAVGVPRVDVSGGFSGLTCSLIDATEHLPGRRTGRAQQALLRATLEAAQDSAFLGTVEGASLHRIASFLAADRTPAIESTLTGVADLTTLAQLAADGREHRRRAGRPDGFAVVACMIEPLSQPGTQWMTSELRRIIGARLVGHLRALDTVIDCRDGMFATVLSGVSDERSAEATIDVLHEILEHPLEIGGHTVHPSLRFTYVMREPGEDLPACVDRARQALGPVAARTR